MRVHAANQELLLWSSRLSLFRCYEDICGFASLALCLDMHTNAYEENIGSSIMCDDAIRFQFVVQRDTWQALGLRCGLDDGGVFRVNGIEKGGLIDRKNTKLESCRGGIRCQVLRSGDRIECVNGQIKPHAMMRQLCIETVIHMRVGRGTLTDAVEESAIRRAEFFRRPRCVC